jgi:hypothetical protein
MIRVAFLLLLMSVVGASCTREFVCQCTITYSGKVVGVPDTTIRESIIKNTSKGAAADCAANSFTSTSPDGLIYREDCVLY